MPLESADYISELNEANPVGSSDLVSSLDDHQRLTKKVLKQSFPNISGAMTVSHTDLNQIDGGTLPAASGENLTSLNADNIASGELSDDRLSDNVPLLDGSNAWSGAHTHSANSTWADGDEVRLGTDGDLRLYHDGTNSFLDNDTGNLTITSVGNITLNGVNVTEYARLGQNNTWTTSQDFDNNNFLLWADTGGTDRVVFGVDSADTLLVGNGLFDMDLRADSAVNVSSGELQYGGIEVGYRKVPAAANATSNRTTVAGDVGKYIRVTGSGLTMTIDNAAHEVGDVLTFIMWDSGNSCTIALNSGTLWFGGVGSQGNRTLGPLGVATAIKVATTGWVISGTGLS